MRESHIRHPNYRGYISVTCNNCDHRSVSPATRYKRNREDLILCPECFEVAVAYPLPSEARNCPICSDEYASTNPSQIYCCSECGSVAKSMRADARKIHTGKLRKRAVNEIYDFLNG